MNKDLFSELAIGGFVHISTPNGELQMLADEQQYAEYLAAIKPPRSALHAFALALAQHGGVVVYGENSEPMGHLDEKSLADFLAATNAHHKSHHFEPQQARVNALKPKMP